MGRRSVMARRRPSAPTPDPAPVPVLRRCRVHTAVLAPRYEYGRTLTPGERVNLDDPVAEGMPLRLFVRDDWFDPPDGHAPDKASSVMTEDEETSDGIASRT